MPHNWIIVLNRTSQPKSFNDTAEFMCVCFSYTYVYKTYKFIYVYINVCVCVYFNASNHIKFNNTEICIHTCNIFVRCLRKILETNEMFLFTLIVFLKFSLEFYIITKCFFTFYWVLNCLFCLKETIHINFASFVPCQVHLVVIMRINKMS